jgi:5-deoxy-glucuronate isomerase
MRFFPARDGNSVITPEVAGWSYSGLVLLDLPHGTSEIDATHLAHSEGALIPLKAMNATVEVDGQKFSLKGRRGVFTGGTDWIYVAPQSRVVITLDEPGELALATAVAEKKFPTKYVEKSDGVEIRGAGHATREVRPFMHPDIFTDAHRLMAVELVTPDGNWSSFPPHRHDAIEGSPANNEEIYYFRIGKKKSAHGHNEGWGFHRTYSAPQDPDYFDDAITVRDGDIYLVPRGFHGPCVAMPGYPMYYLNVLAGPSAKRTMDFCDDPDHAWIRDSWKTQSPDPRVPWRCDSESEVE